MGYEDEMTEEQFLKDYDPTIYERPSITTDILVLTYHEEKIKVLLITRANHPFKGMLAAPGGFVELNEPLHECARRELEEETNIKANWLRQLKAYGNPGRDPRYHIITVFYYTVIPWDQINAKAGDDAGAISWHDLYDLPELASDHNQVCEDLKTQLQIDTQTDPAFIKNFIIHQAKDSADQTHLDEIKTIIHPNLNTQSSHNQFNF